MMAIVANVYAVDPGGILFRFPLQADNNVAVPISSIFFICLFLFLYSLDIPLEMST